MLGNLIGGFIIIVVGVSLMPAVADTTTLAFGFTNASGTFFPSNVTGATKTVTSLVILFYALGIMSAGVAITVGGLKSAGVM